MNQNKSNSSGGAGRQLSKAERYRWIIQEPKTSQLDEATSSSTHLGNKNKSKSGNSDCITIKFKVSIRVMTLLSLFRLTDT